MWKRVAYVAGALALAFPAAGQAQDAGWTGGYAAANLGMVVDPDDNPTGSLSIGYDRAFDGFVGGLELDIARTDVGTDAGVIDNMYRAKLRAGRPVGRTLFYGIAGATHARGDFGGETGYLFGLGLDHRLEGSPVSIGGELLHHAFGDFDGTGDLQVQTLTARVTYRF